MPQPIPVIEIPPDNAWSASGVMFPSNPDINVQLQAVFPKKTYYTIKFSFEPTVSSVSGVAPAGAKAIISWSVAGNSCQRVISVVNGSTISGTAEAVKVKIVNQGSVAANPYLVSILLTEGTRPEGEVPPSTIVDDTQATLGTFTLTPPGPGIQFPVDRSTGANCIYSPCFQGANTPGGMATPLVTTGMIYLVQRDSRGAAGFGGGFAISSHDLAVQRDFIPLHPFCSRIDLQMSAAAQGGGVTYFVSPMWGIDG